MRSGRWLMVIASGLLLFASGVWSSDLVSRISGTRHNLSESGPGPIKSDDPDNEICIFCHAPHRGRVDVLWMWNRNDSTAEYQTYGSSTLHAGEADIDGRRVGQPTGASRLCLSCHDGTIALGEVISREPALSFPVGTEYLSEDGRLISGPGHMSTDLSDDHPVSFLYDDTLAASDGELVSPTLLPADVALDRDGMLQCTSCHDPHDNSYGRFLVMDNRNGALCGSCHIPELWDNGSHRTSTATWDQTADDPWPHTEYTTVAENGCANCHRPHEASGNERLLNHLDETANCAICHGGNVATKNIVYEQGKLYGHFVQNYTGMHDPAEDFSGIVTPHVACASCHNPHSANATKATPPYVPGPLLGVKGIDANGISVDPAQYVYEVCLKCHSGSNIFLQASHSPIAREDPELDLRAEFDAANASYHPVFAPTANGAGMVPSLLLPYTNDSVISCTDCHDNDDADGPRGPHGSNIPYILARNYATADYTPESSFAYALCYQCHDRSAILTDQSGFPHAQHTGSTVNAPCSACHDPHGSRYNTHLINFDMAIVAPNSAGMLGFQDEGLFAGSCNLTCHDQDHNEWRYQ